ESDPHDRSDAEGLVRRAVRVVPEAPDHGGVGTRRMVRSPGQAPGPAGGRRHLRTARHQRGRDPCAPVLRVRSAAVLAATRRGLLRRRLARRRRCLRRCGGRLMAYTKRGTIRVATDVSMTVVLRNPNSEFRPALIDLLNSVAADVIANNPEV